MTSPSSHNLPRRSRLAVGLTYAGLWAECLVLAAWPLLALICLIVGVVLIGTPDLWPLEVVWLSAAAAGTALIWALWRFLRHMRRPNRAKALARVDATLAARPLQTLLDRQAIGAEDAQSRAVWQAHQQRMQAQADAAQPVAPDMRVAKYDPFGLRYIAVLILVIGVLFGSLLSVQEVQITAGDQVATGPTWEGWVQPPSYTRKPTIYLPDVPGETLRVPEGSEVVIRLYGEVGALTVDETVSGRVENLDSAAANAQKFRIGQDGTISVEGPGGAGWDIIAQPDQPPEVAAVGEIEVDENGAFAQRFQARDDYGVTHGVAHIVLNLDEVARRHGLAVSPALREAIELTLPMTISGDRREFEEALVEDLSKHVWVRLPVKVVFEVTDHLGQTGRSPVVELELPGRRFFDPLAKALVEMRRDILWSPDNIGRTSQILRAITYTPDDVFRDEEDVASARDIIRQLEALDLETLTPEQIDEIAELLWALALEIEDGDLASAAEALQRAQEKLAEAIRNGASPEEIARLMDELRQAQQDYMREFAERNPPQEGQDGAPPGQRGEVVTQDQLQEMMDRLQQLMEEGRMAEAQELLEEINRLMENLQTTQNQQGEGGNQEGQQQMQDLADTLRQQQGLSDDSFQELQRQTNPGQQQQGQQGQQGQQQPGQQQGQQQGQGQGQGQQPGGQDGQGQQPGPQPGQGGQPDAQSLAERQQQLRDFLNQQRGNLPGAGTPEGDAAREALDRAGRAMDRAAEDLREGDLPGALSNQADAIDALREGLQDLGEALAQQNGQGQGQTPRPGENQIGQNNRQGQIDPLGRNVNPNGSLGGANEEMMPDLELRERTQELLDEIRRRSGALDRPQEERDYLQRLLDQF